MTFRLLSWNIHKLRSPLRRTYMLEKLKEILIRFDLDVLFLQELRNVHPSKVAANYEKDPLEHLADSVWDHYAYGKNAVYPKGHHGNAILSRFPVIHFENIDLRNHRWEQRGLLHAQIEIPKLNNLKVNLFNTHLDLTEWGRQRQVQKILATLEKVEPHALSILGGDFNDWNGKVSSTLHERLDFTSLPLFKTFPSFAPLLNLDRLFYKNLHLVSCERGHPREWSSLSDHLPLICEFRCADTFCD